MRLIDADALEQELLAIRKRIADKAGADPTWFQTGACVGLETAGQYISKASTTDAVPIKHGHWIEKEYKYGGLMAEKMFCICSVCGEEQIQKLDDKFEQFMTPYCANCGAKMDGGEENA